MRFGIQPYSMVFLLALACESTMAQSVDYSVVSVPEESGTDFTQISQTTDYVCMPEVKRSNRGIGWFSNRILDISTDGSQIAYLSFRNNTTNIFIKDLSKQGSSIQKTNRTAVLDFSYSPDGKQIVFSEARGKTNQIFQTSADKGFVCRQITSGNMDYSPIYSADMKLIFFARQENKSISIWSHDMQNNFLANYSQGLEPLPRQRRTGIHLRAPQCCGTQRDMEGQLRNGRGRVYRLATRSRLHLSFHLTGRAMAVVRGKQ
ncbi:TolB family protein [Paraprevotella clara]|uniref:TolB family protein n=1 Tax=Paraprevotella clara TaxID=454154 RepID=UPI00300ECF5D